MLAMAHECALSPERVGHPDAAKRQGLDSQTVTCGVTIAKSDTPLRVCFVTTGLSTGGAEMMLLKMLAHAAPSAMTATVISLLDGGTIGPRIAALGIPVHAVGLGRRNAGAALLRLRALVGAARPDVVQGWMYHGNLASSMAGALGGVRAPVLWSVRQSLYDIAREKRGTALAIRIGAPLSRRVTRAVIYNSHVSARQHEELGYSADRTIVIPNGFDTTAFAPNPQARQRVRAVLGIRDEQFVVGLSARFHPMKDHAGFLDAAARLVGAGRDARFVLLGKGTEAASPAMRGLIESRGLQDVVSALGERADVADIYQSFDVACSASAWGEGFPNVIGEAMACGVPCVVTNVGDSAALVADTGSVVSANRADLLASALGAFADVAPEQRDALGRAARDRIEAHFSIGAVVEQYLQLYRRVAQSGRRAPETE